MDLTENHREENHLSEKPNEPDSLRNAADAPLAHVPATRPVEELLQALQTYQIELEMQNEQLRHSQLELEKSRDRYVDFYDFAPVGYLTLDRQGIIVEANLTGAALLGVERHDLMRRRFSPFVALEDGDRWHHHFLSVLKNGNKRSCNFLIRPDDGSQLHVRLDSLCLKNDDGEAVVRMVLTDISESVRAKDELRESEQQFRTLTDAMPQMVWITEPSGWNIYFNQQWLDYTGLTLEESYGHGWIRAFHPDDSQRAADAWQHATQTDGIYSIECRLRRADGIYHWWLVRGVSRHDENGKIINWFGTCTDISEQKKTEEQLLDSLRKLEEKERSKTRFLAAAGHDLRQPVAAASLFVYALKHTQPTEQQRELIEKLGQSMNAFSDLLKQLLDISKFDAGVIKPQNATFNLTELCEWLEQTFAQTALNRDFKFHLFFSTRRSLLVHTDIGLLRSVLMNLVSNAIKFTVRGGILVSARPRGGRVLIQIWDTGIGISQVHLPLVFDEFYQVANQQRNREAGLGLGLSICQRAMSLLGGEVTCHSRSGRGSVFAFSLPLFGEKRQVERPHDNSPSTDIAGEIFTCGTRVVLLEDDELVASGMISLLRGFGAEVRHFYNAEDAMQQADITDAEYFIVDYALGGKLTGIGFLESLQLRQLAPLRAVVVTGETSSRFISSVANNPWPLLHKPVDFAKLALALRPHQDRKS